MAITVLPRHDPYEFARPAVQQIIGGLDQSLQKRGMMQNLPPGMGDIRGMLSALPAGVVQQILGGYGGQYAKGQTPLGQSQIAGNLAYGQQAGRGQQLTPNEQLAQVMREMQIVRDMPEDTPSQKKFKESVFNENMPNWQKRLGSAVGSLMTPRMVETFAKQPRVKKLDKYQAKYWTDRGFSKEEADELRQIHSGLMPKPKAGKTPLDELERWQRVRNRYVDTATGLTIRGQEEGFKWADDMVRCYQAKVDEERRGKGIVLPGEEVPGAGPAGSPNDPRSIRQFFLE